MKKLQISIISIMLALSLSWFAQPIHAVTCEREGQCVNNHICIKEVVNGIETGNIIEGNLACGSSQIGNVEVPTSILRFNYNAWRGGTGEDGIGIVVFLSNLVQVFVIVTGIIAMFNFAVAGYIFITSGSDPAAVGKVREKLTWTVIGLIFIVASYMAAGLIGLIFFGDAGFILKPTLTSVYDVT